MCGICGVMTDGELDPRSQGWIRAMNHTLAHRGPDDEGFYLDRSVALGSCRLSIVDLQGGHQPIGSETGQVQVVYNGEIYNYRELRKELESRGHRFATATDTEVVAHGYEEHGTDALRAFNGMFALALWDAARQVLILARDPLGVKPLYYTEQQGTLAFASEIKALLTLPFVSPRIDPEALELYLTFRFVPSPWTLFQGIRKLGPGEMLVRAPGGSTRLQRYAPSPMAPDPEPSPQEWEEGIAAALRAAVKRQMMGDVPVGMLLSGGMDSAAVLAFAVQAGNSRLRSYTVGFAEAEGEDETLAAAETARRLGVEHLHVTLQAADYRAALLPSMKSLDEPVATPSVAPYHALCALAARQHKVVLCGQGADEPWGGYARHRGEKLANWLLAANLSLPARLGSRLFPASDRLERTGRILAAATPSERYLQAFTLFRDEERFRLTGVRASRDLAASAIAAILQGTEHLDPLARFLYLDARLSLADDLLMYGDKIAMGSSLEVRVPFLDLELLRWVERIPSAYRVSLLRPKRLLKRALRGVLPREILSRPKRNFSPPEAMWMQASGDGPGLHWLQESGASIFQILQPREIGALLREQQEGKRDRRRHLFALLALELWLRLYITRTPLEERSVRRALSASA